MVPGGCDNLVGGEPAPLTPTPVPPREGGESRGVRAIPVWESVCCSPSRARGLWYPFPVNPFQGGQVMARARKQVRGAGQAEPGKQADLAITHRHAAGIDVHAAEHFVAVASEDVPAGFVNPDHQLPLGVRKFGTNTADLQAI